VVAASSGTFYGQAMTAGDIYDVAGDGTNSFSGNGVLATSAALGDPDYVATDSAGDLFVSFDQFQRVRMIPAASGTYFGVAMTARYESNYRIRVLAAASGSYDGQAMTAGDIYTIAGDGVDGYSGNGGVPTAADLDPASMFLTSASDLLIADGLGFVREVTFS
jgi:trimeric autotransporter adhesin